MDLHRVKQFLGVAGSLLLVGAFALVGCGEDNVIGPENEPEVTNNTDSFQWQVTDMTGVTQTLTYTWANTGTTANVDQSASLTNGTATLTITDDQGTEVYSRSLTDDGSFQTNAGTAGDWTVTVDLSEVSGAVNFRLQNPDASP